MKFTHVSGSPLDQDVDFVAVCVNTEPGKDSTFKAADAASGGLVTALATAEQFEGKEGQSLSVTIPGQRAKRIVFLGAGDKKGYQTTKIRDLAGQAAALARTAGAGSMCFCPPAVTGKHVEEAAQLAAEGAVLGSYRFLRYRPKDGEKSKDVAHVQVCFEKKPTAAQTRGLKAALRRGEVVAQAICHARDLINEPAAAMTPTAVAEEAKKLAKKPNLTVKILGAKECEKLGMGMFLAVGQGSAQESKLIHLTYKPKRAAKRKVALIGKGVTFDSGGYSIKPSAAMEDMKIDMSGAAAVIAAMGAIAELGSDVEVHAIAACCENLVSGNAYKLGDVLTAMDGTTVEINNTDAEGRLTLGDAICYVRDKVEPDEMFDFATLTGACMVALGPYTAGVMSTDDKLVKRWLAAASTAGEDMWQLPLNEKLKEQLKSPIADMRNTGERWGGAITAGLFLRHFAKSTPWVHVDLAGPASANRGNGATVRGGTGFAVATIVEYLTR